MTAGLVPTFNADVYHRRRETQPRTRRKSTVSIWEDVGARAGIRTRPRPRQRGRSTRGRHKGRQASTRASYAADMWRVRRGVDAPLVGAGTEAMSESKCFLRTGSL